jgi:hypothetical protein
MTIERIFILVKTYPVISEKYKELACTAGLREDGSWIRLYPVPFRLLNEEQRYRKYQWIEADIERNLADPRPESFKIRHTEGIKLLEAVDTRNEWRFRRNLVFRTERIFTSVQVR